MEAIVVQSSYENERGKPMPSLNHGIIQANIIGLFFLHYFKEYRAISELTTKLSKDKQVSDIAIYAKNNAKIRFNARHDQISTTEVPLAIVEILSPKQIFNDLVEKSTDYFANGIQSYWLVVPALRTIHVFSEPDEFDTFSKRDILEDKQLNVQFKLEDIFS